MSATCGNFDNFDNFDAQKSTATPFNSQSP